jgi:ring-1,2-phenylacetyl-CoA epoxidase subunit PaaD
VSARDVAAAVLDPELPVLTIADLGILRDVAVGVDGAVEVTITPTYSGCPAMETIRADVESALREAGYRDVRVRTVLSPAWTTDWLSVEGRRKLAEYGIAPPASAAAARAGGPVRLTLAVRCPRCGSLDTREVSWFGSTACKALYACRSCHEPFDTVKPI